MTMTNGLTPLKERMRMDVEKVINDVRKRRDFLNKELEELTRQEDEAREMLRLISTGRVSRTKMISREEYDTAFEQLFSEQETITIDDLMNATGGVRTGAAQKLVNLTREGVLERVDRGTYKLKDKTQG